MADIYEVDIDGQLFEVEGLPTPEVVNSLKQVLSKPKQKKSVSIPEEVLRGLGSGLLRGGNRAVTGAAQTFAGIADLVGAESARDSAIGYIKDQDEAIANLDPLADIEVGTAGRLAQIGGNLPHYLNPLMAGAQIVGGGAESGRRHIDEGGSVRGAQSAQLIDTAMGEVGLLVPPVLMPNAGKLVNAGVTGTANVAQDKLSHVLQNNLREADQIKALPDRDWVDVVGSFAPGAVFGAMNAKGKRVEPTPTDTPQITGDIVKQRVISLRENTIKKIDSEIESLTKLSTESDLSPEAQQHLVDMQTQREVLQNEVDILNNKPQDLGVELDTSNKLNPYFLNGDPTKVNTEVDSVDNSIGTLLNKFNSSKFGGVDYLDLYEGILRSPDITVTKSGNLVTNNTPAHVIEAIDTFASLLGLKDINFIYDVNDSNNWGQYNTYADKVFVTLSGKQVESLKGVEALNRRLSADISPEVLKQINDITSVGHELGHAWLHKVIHTGYGDYKVLQTLFRDFESWKKQKGNSTDSISKLTPTEIIANSQLHSKGYFDSFGEYLAQRVAKKLVSPDLIKDNSFIGQLAKFLKSFTDFIESKTGIKLTVPEKIDLFIDDFIKKNQELLEQGKDIWDTGKAPYKSLRDSYEDFIHWNYRDGNTPEKPYVNLPKYTDPDSTMEAMKKVPDLSGVSSSLKRIFGRQGFTKIFEDNPLINFTENTIWNAQQKATQIANNLWYGYSGNLPKGGIGPFRSLRRFVNEGSVSRMLEKSSNESLVKVMKAFETGFDANQHYETTRSQYESVFTPHELKLFDTLTDYFNKLSVGINERRAGWFPAVRRGNFMVKLESNNLTIHAETFRSRVEAENFIKQWNALKDKGDVKVTSVYDLGEIYKNRQLDFELTRKITDIIANEIVPNDRDAIVKLVNTIIGDPDPFAVHQRHRSGVKGYAGSKLFETDTAQAWRESLHSVADEYANRVRRGIINKELIPLLDTPNELHDTHKNSVEAAQFLRDFAMDKVPMLTEGLYRAIRDSSDKLAVQIARDFGNDTWFPKTSVFDRTHSVATRFFYINALTARPAFWISQALSSPLAIRQMLRTNSIMEALAASGKGTLNIVYGGNKDFVKALQWVKENTTSFHPNFLNDLNQLGNNEGRTVAGHVFETLSGEKMSTAADSFSRYWAFSMFYELYKAQGMSGKELYKEAAKSTDSTMIMYGRGEKPPFLQQAGVVGQAVSPLMTFAMGNLANFVADVRHAKRTGNIKPAAYTLMVTTLLSGAIGAPFIAEWEFLRHLLLSIDDELEIPSAVESAYKNLPDWVSMGGLSGATGMDVGSGLRWNPLISGVITGQQNFLSILPAFNFAADTVKAAVNSIKYELDGNVSEAEYRNAQMKMTPGGYKGLQDDLQFDAAERDFVPDAQGNAVVPQTTKERVATYLGTRTTDRAKQEHVVRLEKEKDKQRSS